MLTYLINQSAKPSGFVGRIMTKIWTSSFAALDHWGNSLIDFNKVNTILHVGFGSGGGTRRLAEMNKNSLIQGIDISETALRSAARLNKDYIKAGRVCFNICDIAQLTFNDGCFDLIVAGQTHIHWKQLEAGLTECLRVLAEEGTLLITCETDKINYHLKKYANPQDFVSLLRRIGFSHVQVRKYRNYIAFICSK